MSGLLKSSIKHLCGAMRANEILVRLQRSDILVLNYHGVLAQARTDRWSYGNCDSADLFRAQLRWLKRHFSVQGLEGLRRWYDGKRPAEPKPAVLLTFDDGYRNNLTVAAPILKEEGVPALFFLTTGLIGTTNVLWNDEVRVRVLHWPEAEIAMPSGGNSVAPVETAARRALSDKINQACKQLTEQRLGEYLEYLREKTPSVGVMDDPEARAFLTWDEARDLARSGFEIGSHTVSHPILSRIDQGRVRAELRESKAALERELGQPCRALAYPNGTVHDVNATVLEEVRAAGYDWAFMTTPVWQKPGGDPHRIARIGFPGHTDLSTFKFYVSSLHTRLSSVA